MLRKLASPALTTNLLFYISNMIEIEGDELLIDLFNNAKRKQSTLSQTLFILFYKNWKFFGCGGKTHVIYAKIIWQKFSKIPIGQST